MRYIIFCLQLLVLFLSFVALWSMESPDIEIQEKTWLTCCFRKSDCTQKLLGVRALVQHFKEFHAAECTISPSELAQECYHRLQKDGIVYYNDRTEC